MVKNVFGAKQLPRETFACETNYVSQRDNLVKHFVKHFIFKSAKNGCIS